MAKLTVMAQDFRAGRQAGMVLAVMPDDVEFGAKEVLAEGILRVQVVGKDREEAALAQYLNYYEVQILLTGKAPEDTWRREWDGQSGKPVLRARRISPTFLATLVSRAQAAGRGETAVATLDEMIDNQEARSAPAGTTRERDAIDPARQVDTSGR